MKLATRSQGRVSIGVIEFPESTGVRRATRSLVAFGRGLLAFSVAGIGAVPAHAAEWRVSPRIGLKETYTDNLRLATRGNEESDFVTEVSPAVSISGRGARLQLNADYALTYRAYADHGSANGHQSTLRSNALLDIWDRKFFLAGGASIGQQNISTLGTVSTSNINLTANRTEVRTANLSPYWVGRLGTFANWQARYSWNQNQSSGTYSALDSESQAIQLSLSSGSQFDLFGWSIVHSQTQVESSSQQFSRRDTEATTATVRYKVWPSVAAVGTFGRDKNSYSNARGSTGGDFYTIGFDWTPSSRTRIKADVGERYFGNTASFSADHRTRLTSWQVSYSEQITATPGQFSVPGTVDTAATVDRLFQAQFPDPLERQQVVQAYILQNGLPSSLQTSVDFLTNQVSLSKRLQGAIGLRGMRGSVLLSVYRDDRSSQTTNAPVLPTDPFALSRTVVQTGYSTIASWRFTERTSGSASIGQSKSKLADVSREDNTSTIHLGVSHRLGSKVTGSLDYRWLERDSTSGGLDVRENAVIGTLNMAF